MKQALLYFSGSGNSHRVASDLKTELNWPQIFSFYSVAQNPALLAGIEELGLVFPVYYGSPPPFVTSFITEVLPLCNINLSYLFVVLTHGGTVAAAPMITEKLLRNAGYAVSTIVDLKMVDTFIPLFRIPQKKKLETLHQRIGSELKALAKTINNKEIVLAPFKPWGNVVTALLRLFSKEGDCDKTFNVSDACNGCGICEQICPVKNIVMNNKRPQYTHQCQFCLGCYHNCPQQAIHLSTRPLGGYTWYVPPKTFLEHGDETYA